MKRFLIYVLVIANVVLAQDVGPQTIEENSVAGIAAVEKYIIPKAYLLDLVDAKKLPFDVYAWPIDPQTLNQENFLHLVEYVRITGSLGINEFITDEQLRLVMQILAQGNGKLVLNTSPYHRFGCNEDPTNWEQTGKDLQQIQDYFTKFKNFPVAAILLDSECYKVPHTSVTARLNLVYDVVKGIMPNTPIHWYRNGDWLPNVDAKHESRGVAWYRPYNHNFTGDWLARWKVKLNPDNEQWNIWTTLGSGYLDGWQWDLNLHPLHYEYLGKACKETKQPVVLYPGPYRDKCPTFHRSFIAFVKGATETSQQAPSSY